MASEVLVEFPRSLRDMFPAEAQQLYVDAYKQAMDKSGDGNGKGLSNQGMASRDAWDAVKRAYVEDPVTHKWHRIGETVAPTNGKKGIVGALKGLLKR